MKDDVGKIPAKFFTRIRPVADSESFINAREVMSFFKLDPGEYIIIPSTFNPNESAAFQLSVFSKSESHKRNKKLVMTYV